MKKLLGLAVAIFVVCGSASAAITPALVGVAPSGPNFQWSYQISVDNQEQLVGGNYATCQGGTACGTFFTIYDFAGFVSVQPTPANWTSVVSTVGVTPSNQIISDNGSVQNVTFIFTGGTTAGPITNLGGFNVVSTLSMQNPNGTFTYQAQKIANPSQPDQGQGPIAVPSGVPEPASMLLIGGGLIGLAVLRRKFAR